MPLITREPGTVSHLQGENELASIILTTHETNEHSIAQAIQSLESLDGVKESPFSFVCSILTITE